MIDKQKYIIAYLNELLEPKKSILLLGSPIEHSFSPLIHNAAFKHYKLDYTYYALDVKEDELKNIINNIRSLGIKGCNVTIPHKARVMDFLDEISKEALLIGAVNTIVNRDGKLYGYNTDAQGFYLSLQNSGVDVKDKNIAILGAGGASKSIAVKTTIEGAHCVDIYNRSIEKAQIISDNIRSISEINSRYYTLEEIKNQGKKYDIIVNCTPIGMDPNTDNMVLNPANYFNEGTVVVDVIYNPLETKFLRYARKANMKTLNGLDMLLYQGIEAFRLWTGVTVDKEIMKKTLENEGIIKNIT